MADIFISYASSDRPRAEMLKKWFEELGWSVWIDRDIQLGDEWAKQIQKELEKAKIVVVLWGAQALRSEWVQREASQALQSGRLIQIRATALPLLPPFDNIQAVRMQAWTGESGHSERSKLLRTIANCLDAKLPQQFDYEVSEEQLTAYYPEILGALELAFYYCARQVETTRIQRERGYAIASDFQEVQNCFDALLSLMCTDTDTTDDREGVLHRCIDDFMHQLRLLVPDPHELK